MWFFGQKKNNDRHITLSNKELELTKSRIKKELQESFKIDYIILQKKLFKISLSNFFNIFIDYVLNDINTNRELENLNDIILSGKFHYNYTKPLEPELLGVFLDIEFISSVEETVFAENEEKLNERKLNKALIKELYKTTEFYKNIIENIDYLKILFDYKELRYKYTDIFILLEKNGKEYIYVNKDKLSLAHLKEISYYVSNKDMYKIIVISDELYEKKLNEIKLYKISRIDKLKDLHNPFLKTYLVNNLINKNVGDFNFVYFLGDEDSIYKINSSIRYKGKYRLLDVFGVNDVDINDLDADLLLLGGKLEGTRIVFFIKIGQCGYRGLLIRDEGFYYLNLRPFDSGYYAGKEHESPVFRELNEYIMKDKKDENKYIILSSENKKIKLNVGKKIEHAKVNFPLGYSQKNQEMMFNKLTTPKLTGFYFINGSTGNGKSVSLMNFLVKFYDYNVEHYYDNKNILMLENPIEMRDYYFKQVEVDDEDIEDYKGMLMSMKRADLDLAVIGELRNIDLFGIINEISQGLPVFTTFHVSNVKSFMELLKYYCDISKLDYRDVFSRINISVCQMLVDVEKNKESDRVYFNKSELSLLLKEIRVKLGVNGDMLNDNLIKMKKYGDVFIKTLWKYKKYPLKKYSKNLGKKIYEEMVSGEMIKGFLETKQENFTKIYDFMGYNETILYKMIIAFINGEIELSVIKFAEYNQEVVLKVLALIIKQLNQKII